MDLDLVYRNITLFVAVILTISIYIRYSKSSITYIKEQTGCGLLLALAFTIFIGLRPPEGIFGDTIGIWRWYQYSIHEHFTFTWEGNYIFDNLHQFLASIGINWYVFSLILAAIYFIGRYYSCRKLFPDSSYIAYVAFLGAFMTYASATNGFKAGAAASMFCCAIACKDDLKKACIFLFLSLGLHHSMHVCIAAFVLAYFYKNTKTYIIFWLFALVMAVAHITYFQTLFAGYTDDAGARYLQLDEGYGDGWYTGMRYDFVVYSVMPIILTYYLTVKKNYKDVMFTFISNIYIILNAIWLLCMYANFTNRIAALSWALYSLVLVYPFLQPKEIQGVNKPKTLSVIMLIHVLFTTFMFVIYYRR